MPNIDTDLDTYDFYEYNPQRPDTPSVATDILAITNTHAPLENIKETVFLSLTTDGNDTELGRNRALQLLARFGYDQLLRHMYGIETIYIKDHYLLDVLTVSQLKAKAGDYYKLFAVARQALKKSGNYNEYQAGLYDCQPEYCFGLESLIKLLLLLVISTDNT